LHFAHDHSSFIWLFARGNWEGKSKGGDSHPEKRDRKESEKGLFYLSLKELGRHLPPQ
jgi:hypothetical protein